MVNHLLGTLCKCWPTSTLGFPVADPENSSSHYFPPFVSVSDDSHYFISKSLPAAFLWFHKFPRWQSFCHKEARCGSLWQRHKNGISADYIFRDKIT